MTALRICKAALEDASKALEQLSQIGPGHWPTTGRIVAEAGAKARAALEAAAKVGDDDCDRCDGIGFCCECPRCDGTGKKP